MKRRVAAAAMGVLSLIAAAISVRSATNGPGVELPGTQPVGSGSPSFPAFNNEGDPGLLSEPSRCAQCHSAYRAENEKIFEPFDSWAGSMMANAARDPLFWAALDIANQDAKRHLGGAGVGDLCLRCHVPKGWYEGRSTCPTPYGESFDGKCFAGKPALPNGDFEGIQCHVCHRAYDASRPPEGQFADANAPYAGNAQLYLTSFSNTMEGPYPDAAPIRHSFEHAPFLQESAFCGQCHDITNPAKNARDPQTGADLGFRFPIERTFTEWKQSGFARPGAAQSCQSCHMPVADRDGDGTPDDATACRFPPGPRGENTALAGPLRTHAFRGPSTFMTEVLKGEFGGSLDRASSYDAALEQSAILMKTAATVSVLAPKIVIPGRPFQAVVTVTNLAGHKFPSGYAEGRRAYIRLAAGEDANGDGTLQAGEERFVSGAIDPDTGGLVPDRQLRVYEVKLGVFDWNGDGRCDVIDRGTGAEMFHFVLGDCVAKDNRIPPLGFVPDGETKPVGHVYPPDPALPGALLNRDRVNYAVPAPKAARMPVLVRADLMYQSVSKEYVDFLVAESASTCDPFDEGCDPTVPDDRPNRAEKMKALYERYGRSAPYAVASATAKIRLRPSGPPRVVVTPTRR